MNKKKNEVFDPKERPSDSRCIPRKGARQPGIESHLHYSYECGKGVVQPASCMPGLEEWVHSRQYREPSSPLWLGKALSWLITVRLISVKHNMKRISNQRLFGLLWEPRPLLPTNACHSAGPLSLFRPGGGQILIPTFNRLLSLFLACKFWPHHFREEERSSPYRRRRVSLFLCLYTINWRSKNSKHNQYNLYEREHWLFRNQKVSE